MSLLVISNNSTTNPQSIDLSQYVDVNQGEGLDPADPGYTNRVWGRSLQKQGATLALEQLVEREMVFPLKLGPIGGLAGAPTTLSATLQLVQRVNQILETPGAVVTWQPPGASQPTYFDVLSGLMEIAYNYRAEGQAWEFANLRVFSQPLGRTSGPRAYAAASGVGPLLLISPYASGGAPILAASSTGFGASPGLGPLGASSGVSYAGSPSLAGDAPANLQISYVGPLPNTATNAGCTPYVVVSLLPDALYRPLITVPEMGVGIYSSQLRGSTAIASQYVSLSAGASTQQNDVLTFPPISTGMAATPSAPTLNWAGVHRLFAIARASGGGGGVQLQPNVLTSGYNPVASVTTADWGLYDLGTFTFRPSAYSGTDLQVMLTKPAGARALDVNAFVMLPDKSSWFLNPLQIQPSQFGWPNATADLVPGTNYTNTFLLDDTVGDQYLSYVGSQTSAPSPLAGVGQALGTLSNANRITQYARGIVPTPDPKDGMPVIAILSVAQPNTPSGAYTSVFGTFGVPGASWANPQNLRTMAQVNVLERARYVLN